MKHKFLKILLFLLVSVIGFFIDDFRQLGEFYFFILIFIIGYDIAINKKAGLLTVWNFAFLFTINAESILTTVSITNHHLTGLLYLITANNLINIGYYTKKTKLYKQENFQILSSKINKSSATIFFLILVTLYIVTRIQRALYIFMVGRNVAYIDEYEGIMFSELINSIGLVLPAIMTYYYVILKNKSLRIPLLLSLPIFIILFLGGSRFPLLFSILGMLIVYQSNISKKVSIKKYLVVVLFLGSLFLSGQLMKHFRSSSTKDSHFELFTSGSNSSNFPELVAGFMTNEGVINTTSMMIPYFQNNDHLYGQSSSFLLYFWVPRQIWPEKPSMLGYWFIREHYSDISSAHSVSFGFTGDLFADFGWFSLFFVFLLGRILKYAEDFKNNALESKTHLIIIGAMLYPYIFFFVRSPMTATMNFLGILLIYYLIKKLIFSR